jgi:hypothetical protein
MSQHEISVDIYAHWGAKPPTYRIYVDGELMTERDFVYPGNEKYIKENVVVELTPGTHTVTVEQVSKDGTITGKNIMLDGAASSNKFVITE